MSNDQVAHIRWFFIFYNYWNTIVSLIVDMMCHWLSLQYVLMCVCFPGAGNRHVAVTMCCQHVQKSFPNIPGSPVTDNSLDDFPITRTYSHLQSTKASYMTGHVINPTSGSFHGYIPARCLHLKLIPFNAVVGKYVCPGIPPRWLCFRSGLRYLKSS